MVYQLVEMSVTAANLIDDIRVDKATQKGSVYDVIHIVSGKQENYASQAFARIKKTNPEITPKCVRLKINGKGQLTPVADAATLQRIASAVLSGIRKGMAEKIRISRRLGLPTHHMRAYIEEETLAPLMTVFASSCPVRQFSCGLYRIDLYFPAQKVAVECDEGGHAHYSFEVEYERQRFLEQQLCCHFVRYNPHAAEFSIYKLIAQLIPMLTSEKSS
jgi:hypothetical protein